MGVYVIQNKQFVHIMSWRAAENKMTVVWNDYDKEIGEWNGINWMGGQKQVYHNKPSPRHHKYVDNAQKNGM